MQASLRMHGYPLLYSTPLAVRRPVLASPVPNDWITERSLKARQRRLDVRDRPEDSFITRSTDELRQPPPPGDSKPLPWRDSYGQEPLPTNANHQTSSQPPLPGRQRKSLGQRAPANLHSDSTNGRLSPGENEQSLLTEPVAALPTSNPAKETDIDSIVAEPTSPLPPVPSRQPRSIRRRAPACVDNNSVENGAGRRLLPRDTAPLPKNIAAKDTNVDSTVNDTVTRQSTGSPTCRPSMVFEKVQMEAVEPIIKNCRPVTARRLPLQESSV